MYILSDGNLYLGKDSKGRPTVVATRDRAMTFRTVIAADNFIECLPDMLKKYRWEVGSDCDDTANGVSEEKTFGNHSKKTILEEDDFDICEFFSNVIRVMSQLDRFISNMVSKEEITDMKILDIRHYMRDNNHNLSAIQMQRLGYYLQELERERYKYKSQRLIATMFVNSAEALKDQDNIDRMNDVLTSKYRPRILDDTDIDYIVNTKKDVALIQNKIHAC